MKTVYVSGKNDNRLTHVDTRTQFLSEMGFEPIMRRGHCSCGRSDCLCLNDPFSTAEKHNVKLDTCSSPTRVIRGLQNTS